VAELRQMPSPATGTPGRLDEIIRALDALEGAESQRLLSLQLSALGATRFARDVALPLVYEIGERWANGKMGIAQEHLATGVLRSLLGASLQPTASSLLGRRIIFATPTGERHELGLLMAALTSLGAGANPLYLGPELPVEDLLGAVEDTGAAALAISLVTLPATQAERIVGALRRGLNDNVQLWLGGTASMGLNTQPGVEKIGSLEDLEQRVTLFGLSHRGAL
jgi:methanogenic corrinoid protein MtbC1